MKKKEINYEIFEQLYQHFTWAAKSRIWMEVNKWMKDRNITFEKSGVGYNSNLFHVEKRELIGELIQVGFLNSVNNESFGLHQMMFALRDEKDRVVNFASISMKNDSCCFLNKNGLYPAYPRPNTRKLFVTKTILDAAMMLELGSLKDGESVVALFNGDFKEQHERLFSDLEELMLVVFPEPPNNF
jgi:DNA primase